jgi:alcohol dehydrogenase (cytochrome c)
VLKRQIVFTILSCALAIQLANAQQSIDKFEPVTQKMLENPAPEDWLMFSRTYDAQRFSPLDQINKENVSKLQSAWIRGIGSNGEIQSTPLVYNGVMYVLGTEGIILALNAATGDLIWEYQRDLDTADLRRARPRSKNLAIYENMIINTAADNFLIALDARTGELIWETDVGDGGQQTAGPIVMNDIVVSGRACQGGKRESCFIAGHDARTGKELWKFYTIPAMGEPGSETWGKSPDHDKNTASTWGLSGSYDPERNLVLWGIANPVPNTRGDRHGGDAAGTAFSAPADLYSNSTVALVPETGELKWYYQHLPGDDWDMDYTNERILARTRINPDPNHVKWINEDARGQVRDVTVMLGEGGGLFVNDRGTGEFLWATPYPFDTEHFVISDIDTKTGKTYINKDVVLNEPGDQRLICYWNTVSYWPTAYSPSTNSVYATYIDNCLDMTRSKADQRERRMQGMRPGFDMEKANGLAKINLETGEIMFFNQSPKPSSGAMLATAGGLVFNGDLNRYFRAFDDETGEKLWETRLGGPATVSTITYAVEGKQYVAIISAFNFASNSIARMMKMPDYINDHFAIYVYALPD